MRQLLGRGGYGCVYLALDTTSNTLRAVKVIKDSGLGNRGWCELRSRTLPNEIILWEKLRHPNIVSLLETYWVEESGEWLLVMEYDSELVDLFNWVDVHGPADNQVSVLIVQQLIQVVHYMALQGVDHRDIKDENILYNPKTKQIKLIDFGSAGPLTPDPYTWFRGTDVYIPPEYYISRSYRSFPAVVWSIGCLAFVLLAGDCPFQDKEQIRNFTSLEGVDAKFGGRSLRLNFIKSCLTLDPEKRIGLGALASQPWLTRSRIEKAPLATDVKKC